MINQNQEAEATLDDTRHKIQKEIEKREAEVDKYRENMEFLDNKSKAVHVGHSQHIPPTKTVKGKDDGKLLTKDNMSKST